MSEHSATASNSTRFKEQVRQHQFFVLVGSSILIALFLVYVSLSLYQSSGALQLDLSRPGYDSARLEATRGNEVFKGFSATGDINKAALDEFDALYRKKAIEALSIDAFSGEPLSDETLSLDTK